MTDPAGKSRQYWLDRFEEMEKRQHDTSVKRAQEIMLHFDRATSEIEEKILYWYRRIAKNNNITLQEAQQLLTKAQLQEFHWSVEEYIEYGQQNPIDVRWTKELENASAKAHISRLEALKLQTRQAIEKAYAISKEELTTYLEEAYQDSLYHTAYELQKGSGHYEPFARISQEGIKKIAEKPWCADGKTFSSRIWEDRNKLVNNLDTQLTRMCITGAAPDKIIKDMTALMGARKSNVGRLVMTESAYIASEAHKDCFEDLQLEQYEVVATLDTLTSKICQEMDGKIFQMSEYKVGLTAPPFHPNCRTTTAPYFDDEFFKDGTRAARDGEGNSIEVPENMTYAEWKEKFVQGDKSGLQEIKCDDTMELKNKIADADSQITDLKKQFSDITEGYSYDDWFKDFKSIEEGYGDIIEADEPDVVKLKDISQKLKDLIQKKTQWKSQLPVLGGQGTPLSIADALKGANPKFARGTQYAVNCQRCVQTYELRRRGYDVEALPKPKKNNTIVWGSECFVDSSGNTPSFTFNQREKDIRSVLANAPDGSRHIIYTAWKNSRSAHVFIAEKENSIIRFVDPQTNKDNVEDYFLLGKEGKFGILRVDDKDITTDSSKIKATVRW